MEQAADVMRQAKQLVENLTASESPVAAAVAAGLSDVMLGQKIADAIAATTTAVANGIAIANDTSDVVAAMQGRAAQAHHDPTPLPPIQRPPMAMPPTSAPSSPPPAPPGVAIVPSPPSLDAAPKARPPFNMKVALAFGASAAFLGLVALITSKASASARSSRRRRSFRRSFRRGRR